MEKVYVRVAPKTGVESFWRCAMRFTQKWRLMEGADEATRRRLEQEQMLEVSAAEPKDYEDVPAGDSAAVALVTENVVDTSAAAPGAAVVVVTGAEVSPLVSAALASAGMEVVTGALESPVSLNIVDPSMAPTGDTPVVGAAVVLDYDARIAAINAAIAGLDKENPELWTKSGLPTTGAIEAITGFPVSADDRKEAMLSTSEKP